MRGLSLYSDNELYIVDVTLVQKVILNLAYTPIPAAPPAVAGIANIKGGIVTVLSLAELLGRKKNAQAVNAVVFKSFTNGNDQMGLLIDKPGSLIDIEKNKIMPPPLSAEEENICISGIVEADNALYRIIDINFIIKTFTQNGEKINSNLSNGGMEK